jgi:hypothetical protein
MVGLGLQDKNLSLLAVTLADLCLGLLSSKDASGESWESLFVLFLLTRCLTGKWSPPILPLMVRERPVVQYNHPLTTRRYV